MIEDEAWDDLRRERAEERRPCPECGLPMGEHGIVESEAGLRTVCPS